MGLGQLHFKGRTALGVKYGRKEVQQQGCRQKEVVRWKCSQEERCAMWSLQQLNVPLLHCARLVPWSEWQWKDASVQNRDDLYPSLLTQFQSVIFPLIWMSMLCPWGFSKPLTHCSRYWISFLCTFYSNKWLEKLCKILIAVSKHERVCIIYNLQLYSSVVTSGVSGRPENYQQTVFCITWEEGKNSSHGYWHKSTLTKTSTKSLMSRESTWKSQCLKHWLANWILNLAINFHCDQRNWAWFVCLCFSRKRIELSASCLKLQALGS